MKHQIAAWLALSCLWSTSSPVLAASGQANSQQTVIQASVEKTQAESKAPASKMPTPAKDEPSALTINHEFTYVAPEQIPTQITAVLEQKGSTSEDINNKILGGYVPVLVTITNKSDKLLKIPATSVYFVDAKGNTRPTPNAVEVFSHVKRHGLRRALAWGLPIGAASFGILLIPAVVYSCVHTGITNSTLKDDVRRSMLRDGHLSPDSTTKAYVFIPKNSPEPVKLILGRVINTEDETETEKVIEITQMETFNHVNAK